MALAGGMGLVRPARIKRMISWRVMTGS